MSNEEIIINLGTDDPQEVLDILSEKLEDILPEDLLQYAKNAKPIDAAIFILWKLGGKLALDFPKVNLKDCYNLPEEASNLTEELGSYKFDVTTSPVEALLRAFQARLDITEQIIHANDFDSFFPLIVEKDGKAKYVFTVDFENKEVHIPILPSRVLNVDQNQTFKELEENNALPEEIDSFLEQAIKTPGNLIEQIEQMEGREVIEQWAEKHSLTIQYTIPIAIDLR